MTSIKKVFLLVSLILVSSTAFSQPEKYSAESHYRVLGEPARTANASKIEVVEAFWYGCPHCFTFEPLIVNWAANADADIDFVRFPAMFNSLMKTHAQIYFTAEHLNVLDRIHEAAFEALIVERRKLQTQDQIASLFATAGVSKDDFSKAFNSFSVKTKLQQAEAMIESYRLRGTPSMVVNGKYVVMTGEFVRTQQEMLLVVDFLVEKERSLR